MTIYIEYVLLDNITIDYIIVKLIELTLGIKFRTFNKFLLCLFGGVSAVCLPLIIHLKFLSILYKILTSIILVMCLKKYKNFKSFMVCYLLFFAYTFFMGGLVLGLIQFLGIDYTMSSIVMYKFDFPFGLFALIVIIAIKIMIKLLKVAKTKMLRSNYVHRVTLVRGEKKINVNGYWDSGNNVKFKGKGVSIVTINVFLKLYDDITLADLMLNKIRIDSVSNWEYISIVGIGEKQKYLSFEIDSMIVDGEITNSPRLALTYKNFDDYDVVLSNDLKGGKI